DCARQDGQAYPRLLERLGQPALTSKPLKHHERQEADPVIRAGRNENRGARHRVVAPTVTAVGARAPRAGSAEGPVLQRQSSGRSYTTGLPRDLEAESARRLRVVALLYSFVFFVANPLTALLFPEDRAWFLSSPLRWAPSTVSIAMALALVALTAVRRIPAHTILAIGLVFEVVGSFGIAAAQYLDVRRYAVEPPWGGLSWVAV